MNDLEGYGERLCEIAEKLDNKHLTLLSRFLRQRTYQPDQYVVLLGETCCGKSTILNSIVGQRVLPVSPVPSTGAVAEVFLDGETDAPSYAVFNRNATMSGLTPEQFRQLALQPNDNVARLRVTLPDGGRDAAGMRLFDTPGYNSLTTRHEEVLEEFLPNCDSVVYLVNYRMGIRQSDSQFLHMLLALARPGIPFCLVINQTPAGIGTDDIQVKEIKGHVTKILQVDDLPLFIIPYVRSQDGVISTPELEQLWEYIVDTMKGPERQKELYGVLLEQLWSLTVLLRAEGEKQLCDAQAEKETREIYSAQRSMEKLQYAIEKIVEPGFREMEAQLPQRIQESRKRMSDIICTEIDGGGSSKQETTAYVQSHLLPHHAEEETGKIQRYLADELAAMDKKVFDYLNRELMRFELDMQLRFSGAEQAGGRIVQGAAGKLLNASLTNYFATFGGQGGAGAGMANAASHALKNAGDLFGHTFSRATHNSLKHFMAQVGLTSVKTLGMAISGALAAATIVIDAVTWKGILKDKVEEELGKWETEAQELMLADLKKLEEENIKTLHGIIDDLAQETVEEQRSAIDTAPLRDIMASLAEIEKELTPDGKKR